MDHESQATSVNLQTLNLRGIKINTIHYHNTVCSEFQRETRQTHRKTAALKITKLLIHESPF